MRYRKLRDGAPSRDVTEVGAGDYVKVGGRWEEIRSNTAEGARVLPRSWTVRTADGGSYGMFQIGRYARAEDLVDE